MRGRDVVPEVKSIMSLDLARPALPADVDDCAVAIEVEIGPSGVTGGDLFHFEVVTPQALLRRGGSQWGRGMLIVQSFSWEAVDRALSKLVLHATAETWTEAAAQLNREMHWEFDGYTEAGDA
jgi:hypothetical protein